MKNIIRTITLFLLMLSVVATGTFERTDEIKIGNQVWMGHHISSENIAGICYDHNEKNCDLYGKLMSRSQASYACPDGWRLPGLNDIKVLLSNLNGIPNKLGGKLVGNDVLVKLNIKLGGIHMRNEDHDVFTSKDQMEIWLTSSDTIWNNPNPNYAKYNGKKVIGLHVYRVKNDSFNIEPTYMNANEVRYAYCRCIKDKAN
ncbi:hypothetical protein E1176_06645 [Fulvivirga sp. RKSG066]|uniref:FISUMP domain-containing protein n=1 Tax=Fulvivirga aurantia TaxID=2529383 RepID=UPI0012BC063D|nr:FISUMP domain-containing protein [Fulvivirga aurantia]MTI20694.1 hypothetical protein [Fulvivirga aurantia]